MRSCACCGESDLFMGKEVGRKACGVDVNVGVVDVFCEEWVKICRQGVMLEGVCVRS